MTKNINNKGIQWISFVGVFLHAVGLQWWIVTFVMLLALMKYCYKYSVFSVRHTDLMLFKVWRFTLKQIWCSRHSHILTLIIKSESWFVLGMITVEIHCSFMGCSKKRCRDILPTESANHSTSVKRAVPDLQKVMVRLGWEIKKLYVGSCLNETQDVKNCKY